VSGQADVGADRPFTWFAVPGATNYWLTIGTSQGGSDLLNSGPLPAEQTTFAALPTLPSGVPLSARLLIHDGEKWTHVDVSFTAR
jgi:hypothetical protein